MQFTPFVFSVETGEKVPVTITRMTSNDAELTVKEPKWQTAWTSDFIASTSLEKYAVKTKDGELIGLAAYEISQNSVAVYLAYMESHPESNPTMVTKKQYDGIGKLLIANGIRISIDCGFGGAVVLQGKTPELEKHYCNDFGATPLPSKWRNGPTMYVIEGVAASKLFLQFLSEVKKS